MSRTSKSILIVGGAAGLVQAALPFWVECGHKLLLTGRNGKELDDIASKLNGETASPVAYTQVVHRPSDELEIESCLKSAQTVFPDGIDALIIATGGVGDATQKLSPGQSIDTINIEAWQQNHELNLWTPLRWMKIIGGEMMNQKQGSNIVLFDSISAHDTLTRVVPYASGKSALWTAARQIGVEMAEQRVKANLLPVVVNAITPGFFIMEQNLATLDEGRKKAILGRTPMARFGKPEDLVQPLDLLIQSGFINLTNIFVDGGFHGFSGVSLSSRV